MTRYIHRRSHSWPVDPAKYPLSGPTEGKIYLPVIVESPGIVFWILAFMFGIALGFLFCMICDAVIFWAFGKL